MLDVAKGALISFFNRKAASRTLDLRVFSFPSSGGSASISGGAIFSFFRRLGGILKVPVVVDEKDGRGPWKRTKSSEVEHAELC